MRLSELIVDIEPKAHPARDPDIAAVTADSRAVASGTLFAALPGTKVDGATFIPAAVKSGAAAILCAATADATAADGAGIPVIRAAEPRLALAHIAARFYPRQPQVIVAVTGTNGKTSIAEFTRQIFASLGHKAASLGTIGVVKPDGAVYGALTTPDPITLHKTLQELADEGVTHLALEASSHGLDQYRLDGVRLTAGAFNNLGHDHLDYHATADDYFAAKMGLFKRFLGNGQTAIVNLDGPRSEDAAGVARLRGLRVFTTGRSPGADVRLARDKRNGFGQTLTVAHDGRTYDDIALPLIGDYQASNVLVAAAFAMACGEKPEAVMSVLPRLSGVKGRLERAGEYNGGLVVIDYAHKPEALAAALAALRPFATQRLVCLFGCGGDRDRGKRPMMGRIAAEQSNVVIITDDNPRSEDPAAVRNAIRDGVPNTFNQIHVIPDRGEAIRQAVAMLRPGDVLLVAGKGHETGQIVGDETLPFSDHDAVADAIAKMVRT
jgi:UDP-N-acetylmuramoyl-L-alanyl-D-glutamate--2,6-diaminopimelate ligase